MKKVFIQGTLEATVKLDKETTHHLLNVLRFNQKDSIVLGNNSGEWASYKFVVIKDEESIWNRLGAVNVGIGNRAPIVLIQCYLKNDKFDWVIQKATELNVTAIFSVESKHCVARYSAQKLKSKEERWLKIIKEAAQQCGRNELPKFQNFSSVSDINHFVNEVYPGIQKFVAYENEDTVTLKESLNTDSIHVVGAVVLIGPEGGLATDEVAELVSYGFTSVSLGDTILRAETAAIAAVAILNYERG